jgi:hypothetical protein
VSAGGPPALTETTIRYLFATTWLPSGDGEYADLGD